MRRVALNDLQAMHYINYVGREIDRDEFVGDVADGDKAYLLHIGAGYVKLTVAVQADGPEDAMDTAEDWLRNNKPGELVPAEDDESLGSALLELPSEVYIEQIDHN